MRCHLLGQGCCWLPGGAQVPPAHVLPSLHHTCATHFSHRQARVRQTDMQEYIPLHISEQEALPSRHFRSGETAHTCVVSGEARGHTRLCSSLTMLGHLLQEGGPWPEPQEGGRGLCSLEGRAACWRGELAHG